ncbi:MAG: hypothetical protein BYD32DRAFT_441509 [Podila humilis]|nr:MAG: hypothetical protein BYD32DRAFT_441509 [Podila humilis]
MLEMIYAFLRASFVESLYVRRVMHDQTQALPDAHVEASFDQNVVQTCVIVQEGFDIILDAWWGVILLGDRSEALLQAIPRRNLKVKNPKNIQFKKFNRHRVKGRIEGSCETLSALDQDWNCIE